MPKMKTHRGAAKRMRVTGSGKILRRTAHGAHLFKSKSKSRQIRLKKDQLVDGADERAAKRLLGI